MSEINQKPGVAFWATVVMVGLVLYALSMGPMHWMFHRLGAPTWLWDLSHFIYDPLWLAHFYGPDSLYQWFIEYSLMGSQPIEL